MNGSAYLSTVYALINGSLNGSGACYAYYLPASNALYLVNDAGTGAVGSPLTPGVAGSASNSQCTINGASSLAVGTGNTLALTLAVAFKPAARACLASAMEAFYQLPFDRFERYCPYGTAEDVAGFLAPYAAAGCTEFNLIPQAPDPGQAIADTAAVKRLLALS